MSLSVDDLVSSFNTSHIGQEALDLAALQAQLSQTLFSQAQSSGPRQIPRRSTQACNTPIARTPSATYTSFAQMAGRNNDDMDDERMVEDLLMPSSPIATQAPAFNFMQQQSSSNNAYYAVEATQSDFTSTDPFYLAAIQQQQEQQKQSFFPQSACLSQNSPFFIRQAVPQHLENHSHRSLTIDTHPIFASTAY